MTELPAPADPAALSLAAFLVAVLPRVREDIDQMLHPVCCIATFSDFGEASAKWATSIQLTGDCEVPQTLREVGELFESLPAGTMIAWFA